MAKGKRILWVIISILWIIIAGALAVFALGDENLKLNIIDFLMRKDLKLIFLISAGVLLVTALILIIDLIIHRKEKKQYLIKSENGKVFIAQNALNATVRSAVSQFPNTSLSSVDVVVNNENSIQAKAKCDVFEQGDFKLLGESMKEEIANSLQELTGITDVKVDLNLDKAQQAMKREIR